MNRIAPLIETICIKNGRVQNIHYHNQRFNASRKELFGSQNQINLRNYIEARSINSPIVKCRITYATEILNIEYEPYTPKRIQSLKLIEIGSYTYNFKFANRHQLNVLFEQREDKDDVLLTKNGWLTDTSYANIALRKDNQWYTPQTPLLQGTQRAKLLERKQIIENKIHKTDLPQYELMTVFNAMMPFQQQLISIGAIE